MYIYVPGFEITNIVSLVWLDLCESCGTSSKTRNKKGLAL